MERPENDWYGFGQNELREKVAKVPSEKTIVKKCFCTPKSGQTTETILFAPQ